MCSRPRKPQRKPKPSASDVSGSKKNDASFSRSFSSASRSSGYCDASTGYRPAKTIGFSSLKPGNGVRVGRAISVMVSPIFASATFLMLATMKPASPTPSDSTGTGFGVNAPSCSISIVLAGRHQADLHAGPHHAVDDARENHDAAVRVVPGVEDQRLQRRVGIASRRRQAVDDRLENLRNALAFLGAGENRAVGVEADDVVDLPAHFVRLRARQVDLVDDRNDLEVVLDREIRVGQRLRLDTLRRVDEQQRALARRQRPRDLVREVDVAGRVDQIEDVVLAVVGAVGQPNGVRLDGDAALALEVHAVEDLRLHLARLEGARQFEQAVGQRRLAVVDVGDDREIADVALVHDEGFTVRQPAGYRCSIGRICCGYGGPM